MSDSYFLANLFLNSTSSILKTCLKVLTRGTTDYIQLLLFSQTIISVCVSVSSCLISPYAIKLYMSMQIATFIVEKIMSDEVGLDYVCATAERYFAVGRVLDIVLESLEKQPSPRLLKIIIPCYARLSSNPRLIG